MERTATPGAFKLPAGSRDREQIAALEARVTRLEQGGISALPDSTLAARMEALEAMFAAIKAATPVKRGRRAAV